MATAFGKSGLDRVCQRHGSWVGCPKTIVNESSPNVWKTRMRALQRDCVASVPKEQAARIREAARLLGGRGARVAGCPPIAISSNALEAMLSAGAFESAVLHVMGSEAAFMLSRGGNGSCLATVVQPDGAEEMIAEGATPALALLAAHLAALVEDSEPGCVYADPEESDLALRLN